MNKLTPVHELKGIGDKTEKLFIKERTQAHDTGNQNLQWQKSTFCK